MKPKTAIIILISLAIVIGIFLVYIFILGRQSQIDYNLNNIRKVKVNNVATTTDEAAKLEERKTEIINTLINVSSTTPETETVKDKKMEEMKKFLLKK